jgi:NAD(P)-dependent dehydrogenase (short-subunit alcohol dehydrogenase family)
VRIIVVGGAGTIGTAVVELLSARHDVVVAGRQSGDIRVDISLQDSVRCMYERIGSFDALASAAGEAHFGPFETATEEELALGVHSIRVRINAVSPGLAEDSYEQFGAFNPGRASVPMRQIASAFQRSIEGWRSGEITGHGEEAPTFAPARRSRSWSRTRGRGNRIGVLTARV